LIACGIACGIACWNCFFLLICCCCCFAVALLLWDGVGCGGTSGRFLFILLAIFNRYVSISCLLLPAPRTHPPSSSQSVIRPCDLHPTQNLASTHPPTFTGMAVHSPCRNDNEDISFTVFGFTKDFNRAPAMMLYKLKDTDLPTFNKKGLVELLVLFRFGDCDGHQSPTPT